MLCLIRGLGSGVLVSGAKRQTAIKSALNRGLLLHHAARSFTQLHTFRSPILHSAKSHRAAYEGRIVISDHTQLSRLLRLWAIKPPAFSVCGHGIERRCGSAYLLSCIRWIEMETSQNLVEAFRRTVCLVQTVSTLSLFIRFFFSTVLCGV